MLIRVPEASKLANIPETTIRDMIKNGKIKTYQTENERAEKLEKSEFLMSVPTVITMFNQKGGVGKSTLSVLLSDYFEKKNFKILLIDLDEQSNLTQTYFGYDEIQQSETLYDFFDKKSIKLNDIIKKYNDNIDLIPASIKMNRLAGMDISEANEYIDKFKTFFRNYQLVILDCPPALNFFSRMGVVMANYCIIPLQAEPYSYDGLNEVTKTITKLRYFNQSFIDFFAIINNYKGVRTVLREEMRKNFEEVLKERLFPETIPECIGYSERAIKKENVFYQPAYKEQNKKLEVIFDELCKKIYEDR